MALIASLITGHGETEHITSFDARAYNRATFGDGKYILQDEDNLKTQVSALTGTIQISKGSCLWSGMHIRVEEEGSISYTSPASTNYVYVWLHYVRNPENLVESVEFVTTTGTKPETSLIVDNLNEDMTEAYTLFCSFTHDTSSNSIIGLTSDFSARQPLDDTAKAMQSNFSSLQTNISGQLQGFSNRINETTAENNQKLENMNAVVSAMPLDIKTDLSNAVKLGSISAANWITFNEPIMNFAFVLFVIICKGAEDTVILPRGYSYSPIRLNTTMQTSSDLYAVYIELKQDEVAVKGKRFGVDKFYAYAHSDKGVLGGYTRTEIPRSDVTITAYGIGRIQEA